MAKDRRNTGGPNKRAGETGPNTGGNLNREFTISRKEEWCQELAVTGRRGDACRKVGVSRQTITKHLREDAKFRAMHDAAMEDFRDFLEREMQRRAVEGVKKPVFYKGRRAYETDPETKKEVPAFIREFDTPLLIMMAKRHIAEYRDKIVTENRNLNLDMGLKSMEEMTPAELEKLEELLNLDEASE